MFGLQERAIARLVFSRAAKVKAAFKFLFICLCNFSGDYFFLNSGTDVAFWYCSVKHVTFYDDDVRYWQASMARSAAGELSITAGQQYPASGGGHMTIKGRHFLVVCCENKVIFLDLVSMRARDVPRTTFDSKSPLW